MTSENNNRSNASVNKAIEYLRLMEQDGCTISDLIAALESLPNYDESSSQRVSECRPVDMTLRAQVSEILKELEVPKNLIGYEYLKTAIVLAYHKPSTLKPITQRLYPAIANVCNSNMSSVVHGMMYAIEATWKCGDPNKFSKYLGKTTFQNKSRPTTSKFISTIVKYLDSDG